MKPHAAALLVESVAAFAFLSQARLRSERGGDEARNK